MVAVAHRRLGHLRDQRLGVAQHQQEHFFVAVELVLELLAGQAVGMPGALHNGAARRAFAAHEDRNADQAFVADHRDLGRGAVLHYVQQRHDGVGGKVDVAQGAAGLVEHLAKGQLDQLEVGQQAVQR
ncbi:hypothetical protein D3C72_1579150 [compost metagenome]